MATAAMPGVASRKSGRAVWHISDEDSEEEFVTHGPGLEADAASLQPCTGVPGAIAEHAPSSSPRQFLLFVGDNLKVIPPVR